HCLPTRRSISPFITPSPPYLYTLSLHDALPISLWEVYRTPWSLNSGGPGSGLFKSTDGGNTWTRLEGHGLPAGIMGRIGGFEKPDRKSTRLNSSHGSISYAVFCLKKKNTNNNKN